MRSSTGGPLQIVSALLQRDSRQQSGAGSRSKESDGDSPTTGKRGSEKTSQARSFERQVAIDLQDTVNDTVREWAESECGARCGALCGYMCECPGCPGSLDQESEDRLVRLLEMRVDRVLRSVRNAH